ncbi:MAG: hypothetical protein LBQ66_05910 [Planctomycetaceae bacterium]|jgi:hypothetical protein|nr:hypothetical protein [Planctomycetaceae bacterium]
MLRIEWLYYSAEVELIPVVLEDFFPINLEFYDSATRQLESFGFRFFGDYENLAHTKAFPEQRTCFRFLINTECDVVAKIFHQRVLNPKNSLAPKNDYMLVEFATEFDDNTILLTANAEEANPLRLIKGMILQYMPHETPLDELLSIHETKFQHICEQNNTKPIEVKTFSDLSEYCVREHEVLVQDRRKKGGYTNEELTRLFAYHSEFPFEKVTFKKAYRKYAQKIVKKYKSSSLHYRIYHNIKQNILF